MADSASAMVAATLATAGIGRIVWQVLILSAVLWSGSLFLSGAYASGALRTRRQASATLIAAVILTGTFLTLILALPGLLLFAVIFSATLLVAGLGGRMIAFARMGRSPVGLVLVMDKETADSHWSRLTSMLGPGYRVRAIVDPGHERFAEQLLSVLAVRTVEQLVAGPGSPSPVVLNDLLRTGGREGINVLSLDELYEDLTGQCLDPEQRIVTALRGSIWRSTGARGIDISVGLLYLPLLALLVPLSALAGGNIVETSEWRGKNWQVIRVRRLPSASRKAGLLRRILAWGPLRWAPAAPSLLTGKLSVIGPAPVSVEFSGQPSTAAAIPAGRPNSAPESIAAWQLRQSVRPGITGWAALNGCKPGSWSLPFDLYYVRHRSLGFDLGILLRTLATPVLSWRALNAMAEPVRARDEEIVPGALAISPSASLVSVIVPAYRERGRIASSLELLMSEMSGLGAPFEVILVSDGNTDGTQVEAGTVEGPITVIHYPENRGKGYAIRRGLAESRGSRVVFIDADMELHPRGIARLLALLDAGADVAIGSKRHPESRVHYPWPRRVQSGVYQRLVRRLFGLNVTDTQTGIKAFRGSLVREVAPSLTNDGFAFDLELLVQLASVGAVIAEGPVVLEFQFRSTTGVHAAVDVLRETLRLWHGRRHMSAAARDEIIVA
ncbi:MAG TPA: glycosyltransferase [Chloroflexota bacterium]|nr:glycosyltransferase [Chloroflexota bacterium]